MFLKKILAPMLLLFWFTMVTAQQTEKKDEVCYNPNAKGDTSKKSIKSAAVGKIGEAKVTINYHSPGVRKRVIWGGLVPYDEVWVTGAHDATTIEMDKPFMIGGKTIPAGKYALFSIPGKTEWTIILNKNWKQHLTNDYNDKEDMVRIKIKPKKQNNSIERLQYYIQNGSNKKGTIAIAWEKIRIEFGAATL